MRSFFRSVPVKVFLFIVCACSAFHAFWGVNMRLFPDEPFGYCYIWNGWYAEPLYLGILTGVCVLSFAILMAVAGKKPGADEPVAGLLTKLPTEVPAAIAVLAAAAFISCAEEIDFLYRYRGDVELVAMIYSLAGAAILLALVLLMDLAARIRTKSLFKNSLTCHIVKWLIKWLKVLGRAIASLAAYIVKNLTLVPKACIVAGLTALADLILSMICAACVCDSLCILFWFIRELVFVPALIFFAIILRRLQRAGERLAAGELDPTVDNRFLFGEFKKFAATLSNISDGIGAAVDERLKSERMRTELITNVSHDLKTPITSMINYAGLIADEKCDNEKIKEYSEVLVRQSGRLKKLVEDLIEASKASTGNVDVNAVPCDVNTFIRQSEGEYADRLEAAGLTLVTKCTEEPLFIMADGRCMWRIFDNLLGNICKYSLEGSRVYLSCAQENDKVKITFRNTARDMICIEADELMERFSRGDSSRNTEGNGLGLSIASGLAAVQKGELKISVDGDLFKAVLMFPVAVTE